MATVVELPRIPVMCTTAIGGGKGVQGAIDTVESKIQSLKGRKCYGVITRVGDQMSYQACVVIQPEDNPQELGLEPTEIPAGKYARERIRDFDYRKDVPRVIATFERLTDKHEIDYSRPSLEFYRRHDEILVHVPIK